MTSCWQSRRRRTLHQPEVLQKQVHRMLADSRSQALVDNFAGQWLFIRNVTTHQPSPEIAVPLRRQPAPGLRAGNEAVLR